MSTSDENYSSLSLEELLHFKAQIAPDNAGFDGTFTYRTQKYITKDFNIIIKSRLLKLIIKRFDTLRWVDVENIYYNCLKDCSTGNYESDHLRAMRLNEEFDFLKAELERYLVDEIENANTNEEFGMEDIFKEAIDWKRLSIPYSSLPSNSISKKMNRESEPINRLLFFRL